MTSCGGLADEILRGITKQRHMCMEEGTLSEWLHEFLERPLVMGCEAD
jgi:hypothetical protein